MDYLLKSSAIIALFYLCYRIFLQRETFFQSNRWFLITGLGIALFLPSIVIPIYIEYTPIASTSIPIMITESATEIPIQEAEPFNWMQALTWLYAAGVIFFLLKLLIELASLKRLIEKNPKKKVERFSLIEIFEQIAPFSFFKWIVYNPKQFKKQELNYIINHEKIHAKEHHTIDILMVQLCCAIFWFNPLIWLYKKELQQNLEFIADHKAQSVSDCKESYQKLLLKASVPNQQLVLTNNFYNSLIKKRIIMLHKSKSNKLNAWKYALVIPALALFLMSFNTEEIYVVKDIEPKVATQKDFIISATSTDNNLELITNYFKNKPVQLVFSEVTRNSENQLKSLSLNTKYTDGSDYTNRVTVSKADNEVITPFKVSFNSTQEDVILNFLEESLQTKTSEHKVTIGKNKTIGKTTPTDKKPITEEKDESLGKAPLYVIGNKQYKKANLPSNKFTTKGSIVQLNKQEAKKRFGNAGKDGAIILNGKTSFNNIQTTSYYRRGEIVINKDFSDADLNLAKAKLEKEGLKVKIRGVKRNSNGEITAIKIDVSSNNAKANYNLNGDEPIKPIQISYDHNGENISIGNGRSHNYPVVVDRINLRNQREAYRTKGKLKKRKQSNSYIISTETHDNHENNNCEADCEHDHDVHFEYHIDSEDHSDGHDNEDIIVRGTNSYIIKNSNSNNGKRTVTITNDNGKDEIIELKSKDNVYVLKSKDGKISSKNLTWVNDDDDDNKVEYKFRSKKKGNSFFISTDDDEKPYILLDGKEISYKEMNNLDSDTFKSVNVLKGKSATNKYGDKAKDGAIIISTKD